MLEGARCLNCNNTGINWLGGICPCNRKYALHKPLVFPKQEAVEMPNDKPFYLAIDWTKQHMEATATPEQRIANLEKQNAHLAGHLAGQERAIELVLKQLIAELKADQQATPSKGNCDEPRL